MLIQSWVIYGFTTRRTYLVSVRFRGRQGRVYYCRLSPQLCINKVIAPLSAIFIIFRSFDYLLAQFYTACNERHLSDNSPKNEYLLSVVDSFQQSLFVRTCPTKVDICHPLILQKYIWISMSRNFGQMLVAVVQCTIHYLHNALMTH